MISFALKMNEFEKERSKRVAEKICMEFTEVPLYIKEITSATFLSYLLQQSLSIIISIGLSG